MDPNELEQGLPKAEKVEGAVKGLKTVAREYRERQMFEWKIEKFTGKVQQIQQAVRKGNGEGREE